LPSILKTLFAIFDIIFEIMNSKKKKKPKRPIYDSIRKPTAPPSVKFGKDKPDENIHPSLRKVKHKKNENLEN
jgi:hypothetical protein